PVGPKLTEPLLVGVRLAGLEPVSFRRPRIRPIGGPQHPRRYDSCRQETLAPQQEVARSIGSPSKTRSSDPRPAFTCVAAAADFPFPLHPHMPTKCPAGINKKLVIVFRRAILTPREGSSASNSRYSLAGGLPLQYGAPELFLKAVTSSVASQHRAKGQGEIHSTF